MAAIRAGLGGLTVAALLLAAIAAAPAHAERDPKPTLLPPVTVYETPPLRDMQTLRGRPQRQQVILPQRLRDGTPTNDVRPRGRDLAALPSLAPNAAVLINTTGSPRLTVNPVFAGVGGGVACNCTPPDQALAVATIGGKTFVVNSVNTAIQIFDGSGASLSGPTALSTFYSTTLNLSDPRVQFDATTQRWFVTILAFQNGNAICTGASPDRCQMIVAVSKTSDPTGAYNVYQFDASSQDLAFCAGTPAGCFPDQPHTGFDANGFYIAVDLFPNAGGNAQEAIFALSKSAMVNGSGGAITPVRFLTTDFVIMPSVPAASEPFVTTNGGTEYMLTAPGSGTVRLYAVYNTSQLASSPSSVKLAHADVTTQAYGSAVPMTQPDDSSCGFFGSSACSQLDGGRTSFTSETVVTGGVVFGALPAGANDGNNLSRDVVAWFGIQPTLKGGTLTASVFKQGTVVPPNGYSIGYPAFAFRNPGEGIMSLDMTANDATLAGGFESAAVVPFFGFAPVGNIIVTGQGVDIDDDFSCPSQGGGRGTCRLGDYSAATVDPGTGNFWTAGEQMATTRDGFADVQWSTFMTQVQ